MKSEWIRIDAPRVSIVGLRYGRDFEVPVSCEGATELNGAAVSFTATISYPYLNKADYRIRRREMPLMPHRLTRSIAEALHG